MGRIFSNRRSPNALNARRRRRRRGGEPRAFRVAFRPLLVEMLEGRRPLAVDLVSFADSFALSTTASGASQQASLSTTGQYLAFASAAADLVSNDLNTVDDVFVRDRVADTVTLASVTASGTQGNGASTEPSISADGSLVVFQSAASNLVAGDTNGVVDIFLKNLTTGVVTRISLDGSGGEANGASSNPFISADGKFVAFESVATNLVTGDNNSSQDIFLKNLTTGAVTRISTTATGAEGNGESSNPWVSSDGAFVAFDSVATNLVASDSNGVRDVFRKAVSSGAIVRASTDLFGAQGNLASSRPSLSGDGTYLAFESDASNLVGADSNMLTDIFIKTMSTGVLIRASVDSSSAQGNGVSSRPILSSDGFAVSFESDATNLVSGDNNGVKDVFVKNRLSGAVQLASAGSDSIAASAASSQGFLSGDGNYVALVTDATSFATGDVNNATDVILRNRSNGAATLSSPRYALPQPLPANGDSRNAAANSDGGLIAFESAATNLVSGDTNGATDIFLRNLTTSVVTRVSLASTGIEANGASSKPSISSDGSRVAFESWATNLVSGDTALKDIFVKTMSTGAVTLASSSAGGFSGNADSFDATISGNGQYVAFVTASTNFDGADTNGVTDIYVKNLTTGAVNRVSSTSAGGVGNGASFSPSISDDGTWIAFVSSATNLVTGDTNGLADVFVKNRLTGAITRVSADGSGGQANGASSEPAISGDGQYVAFASAATNLVAGVAAGNVYVKTVGANTIVLASASEAGAAGNGVSSSPSLSTDGRIVAFQSTATNWIAGDTATSDVYVKSLATGVLRRMSENSAAQGASADAGAPALSGVGNFVVFDSTAMNLASSDRWTNADVFRQSTAGTRVSVSSGNVVIATELGGATDDNLTLSINGSNLRIRDSAVAVLAGAGATQVDSLTVDVPLASITGSIQSDTGLGSDRVTLDLAGGIIGRMLDLSGGTGASFDQLTIQNGAAVTLRYDATSSGAGRLYLNGAGTPAATFSNLEAVSVTTPITDATLQIDPDNSQTGASTTTVEDALGANMAATFTRGVATFGFATPTQTLTIVGDPTDADTIQVNGVDSDAPFRAAVSISGQGGSDAVQLNAPLSLGSATSSGAVTVTAEAIRVAANVQTNMAATAGAITLNGAVTLGADATLNADSSTTDAAITINGPVDGAFGLTVNAGSANVTFAGSGAVGAVTPVSSLSVSGGAVNLTSLTGTIFMVQHSATLNVGGNVALQTSGTISVNSVGSATGTIAGNITGGGGLQKLGTGSLTLPGANSFSGFATVQAGTLNVTGTITGSANVTVTGGTLIGSSNIGSPVLVQAAGTIQAGPNAALLNTGSLTFQSGGTLHVEIGGATAGSGYDQLNVTGTVNLNSNSGAGSVLSASLISGFTPGPGFVARIVQNDGVDAVSPSGGATKFSGLTEGSLLYASGFPLRLSYVGGDGNDVTLSAPNFISVSPTSGLTTSESGSTANFVVSLDVPPTGNVTLGLSSSNSAEGTVSPSAVVFTPANWNSPQTVTVTGANDSVVDGAKGYSIVTAAATSSDPLFHGRDPADVLLTNNDDDVAAINVSPTSGLITSEVGGTATFAVTLNSQPTGNVTIGLSSSNSVEGAVSPGSLVFTAGNWNLPQTATVTGANDFVADGTVAYSIITAPATSSDANYNGRDPANVAATNTDNDFVGVNVSPTSGLVTNEAGATASFTIALNSQPLGNVTIGLSSTNTNEGTVSPASLVFTPGNWNTAQSVTATGVNDSVVDGAVAYSLVTAPATSSDLGYNGFDAANVSVTNTDNDVAGISVSPMSGLVTSEAGSSATFSLTLSSQPTSNVTIGLSSSNTGEGTVAPASLVFTAANWNSPQTATVTGVNDFAVDGSVAYSINTAPATSSDPNYSGRDPANVSLTNSDNDVIGVTVSPTAGLVTSEAGATASFTIALTSQPSNNVTIGLSSTNTGEGTVSPASLVFTPGNWNAAQSVTAAGVNDFVVDGSIAYSIVTAPATSLDSSYNGFDAANVLLTNTDNDVVAINVSPTSGLVTSEAGGTATFAVSLNSQPTGNVTIGLSSSNTSEGTVAPASLVFTPANWNAAQSVTATGVNDFGADGSIAYSILTAPATSSDTNYNGLDAANASVTNTDNDAVGILVSPTAGLVTSELGATATFAITLNSQPTGNVTIGLSSSNSGEGTVSPTALIFSAANWSSPQTATVMGANDFVVDGSIAYSMVTAPATSSDTNYNGLDAANVSVTNSDNDVAGISVSPTSGLVTSEAGGSATFSLTLSSQPTGNVTIGLSSSNSGEGTVVPASLVFTNANWNSPQTATVTGANDFVADGSIAYSIVTAPAVSGDANYNGRDASDVSVTNTDDDPKLPWHNLRLPEDVDNDGIVAPVDALLVINDINFNGSRQLPPNTPVPFNPPTYIDVDGDNILAPVDALIVINYINARSSGEAEAGFVDQWLVALQITANETDAERSPAQYVSNLDNRNGIELRSTNVRTVTEREPTPVPLPLAGDSAKRSLIEPPCVAQEADELDDLLTLLAADWLTCSR